MAIFEDKNKKKSFHMNPQMGRALHGGVGKSQKNSSENNVKGHIKDAKEPHHQAGFGEAEHLAHPNVHHVELHHGGHPGGHPPAHEGHTHHTIHHPHDGGEPQVRNHESYDEASDHVGQSMDPNHGQMESGEEIAENNDDGSEEQTEAVNYGD